MQTWVVVASGQSLTDEQVEYVRSKKESGDIAGVIAVSDVGLLKAPWADALVSHDSNWWIVHPEALDFKGKKFSSLSYRGTIGFPAKNVSKLSGCNSGLLAMFVAKHYFKAQRIILLGFDMHGTHFFGPHTATAFGRVLKNTPPPKFLIHLSQFKHFTGCEVINCTPGSALELYKMCDLKEAI